MKLFLVMSLDHRNIIIILVDHSTAVYRIPKNEQSIPLNENENENVAYSKQSEDYLQMLKLIFVI